MGLNGMIGKTAVKDSGVGDSKRPHDLATATTEKLQAFRLLDDRTAKQIIVEVGEVKQSIKFRMIEGDLMELYKTFIITYHVDTNGEDNLITWTLEYEKLEELGPHPGTLLNYFLHVIEDIEAHHLNQA
ncbi:OLC1v1015904C1 [Oldenlandia corymbosa var. corymbosa]|uniref:OLC1v1015904C1 n=1 Tax=Oldenlandia corymbosa var. corymbosa TaxID=529605 RepID=A0AAV1E4G1_OLDCO|nr:OLC1v1015904C1 [Oldenlandia corymbosa var. corymbosa]